jgi:hypothetical protein
MVASRRRLGVHLTCSAVVAVGMFVWSLGISVPAYASSPGIGSVLKTTKTDIADQSGVHLRFVAKTGSSSTNEKIVANLGTSIGVENVVEGAETLTVEVAGTHAYVKGNKSGLTKLFGLSSSQAKRVGSRWMSWRSGTSQYSELKSNVTLASVSALLPSSKGTKLSTETSNGRRLYVLKWTTGSTSSTPQLSNTFTISTGGSPLPVEETSTDSSGDRVTTQFSSWSEQVAVSAPPSSSTVAYSKLV